MKFGIVTSALFVLYCAVAAEVPKPTFVDATQSTIALEAGRTGTKADSRITPMINYGGAAQGSICFLFQVQDDKNRPVKASLSRDTESEKVCFSEKIERAQIRAYSLELSVENVTRPLSGFLIAEITQQELTEQKGQTPAAALKDKTQTTTAKEQDTNKQNDHVEDQKAAAISIITKPVRLLPPVKSRLSQGLFGVPFGIALGWIAIATFAVRRLGLFARMGSSTWDFSQSWASNFAVAGTVLTTLLGFSGLGEYGKYMSKNSYWCLSILFGALVMLAPAVYNFTRRSISVPVPDPDDPNNISGVRLEGHVLGFLLASFVTLWAVLGQFFITAFVLRELVDLGPLPSSAATAFIGVIILLAALLLVYSFVTIYFTVKKQVNHHRKWLSMKKEEAVSQAETTVKAARLPASQIQDAVTKASAVIDQQKPLLPKWPLL